MRLYAVAVPFATELVELLVQRQREPRFCIGGCCRAAHILSNSDKLGVFDVSGTLVIQSMMYLKLSVAGHFMIFAARTRGPFWSFAPAPVLVVAVLGTQLLATFIVVYGVFMAPIGWALTLVVWAYALVWFLITDSVKVLFYRHVLDRTSRPAPAATHTPTRI